MSKLRIDVTQEDIDSGAPRRACRCPIALVCRRVGLKDPAVFPGAYEGNGSIFHGEFGLMGRSHVYLPEVASQFVRDLDEWKPVAPFSFEIDLPDKEPK